MPTTMGKNRVVNNIKEAVDKAVETTVVTEVATEEKAERKTARRSSASARKEIREKKPTTRKLREGATSSAQQWYLKHEGELEGVTSESSNPTIGVTEIKVFDPSEGQWNNGTVAVIQLETIIGRVKGIQVRESTRDGDNSLWMQTQSRFYMRDEEKVYVNDLELSRKVEAQILSYVETLLVPAGE